MRRYHTNQIEVEDDCNLNDKHYFGVPFEQYTDRKVW
jgi:hypothetical protein